MNTTKWTGQECPPNYTVKHNAGQLQLTLYTDIKEETTSEGVKQWTATQIFMPVGVTDYGSIVSAIINSHYSNDQMQAIVNNHLIGEHEDEFAEMQEYRVYAKQTARKIVDEIENGEEV